MTDPVFVDSNVLVYRRDLAAGEKQRKAEQWIRALWKSRAGRLSVQVLNEFYHIVTRKLSPGLPRPQARQEVLELMHWRPLPLAPDLPGRAFRFEESLGTSYWDSLIIAAACATGSRYLLSEDLQDGQEVDGVVILDPFAHTPASIGLR